MAKALKSKWTPKKSTVPVYLGSSSDGRTNRWMIICTDCGRENKPATTLRSKQFVECSCGCELFVDYNNNIVVKCDRG